MIQNTEKILSKTQLRPQEMSLYLITYLKSFVENEHGGI